ncbi:hypothetical protein ACINNAV83_A0024, partial [Acinetobacter baumannii Naval-83]
LAICPRLPCNMSTFTLQYVHVYLAICPRLPCISTQIILTCTYTQ